MRATPTTPNRPAPARRPRYLPDLAPRHPHRCRETPESVVYGRRADHPEHLLRNEGAVGSNPITSTHGTPRSPRYEAFLLSAFRWRRSGSTQKYAHWSDVQVARGPRPISRRTPPHGVARWLTSVHPLGHAYMESAWERSRPACRLVAAIEMSVEGSLGGDFLLGVRYLPFVVLAAVVSALIAAVPFAAVGAKRDDGRSR